MVGVMIYEAGRQLETKVIHGVGGDCRYVARADSDGITIAPSTTI